MFFNRIFITTISFIFILNFSVSADVFNKNINYYNVVTEYYSDDIYDDIIETSATPTATPPEINAKSAVLMEVSTGEIIYKHNENKKVSPASITKIMTMLLIVESIENKKLSFYDKVTTSEHAASMGGSQIWLETGEKMTVHDLLKAVAVGSANDASVALAEHIAGSEESFVSIMNKRAKELGMNNTNFSNACGLDDENLYTSAKDVAIMSRELIKHDIIKQYTTIWMDTVRNETVQLVNTNKLVRFYKGCTGLKTGTTSRAGCCVSATAKKDDMELIAVIMGADTSNNRFLSAKKLLDYGFANLNIYKTSKNFKKTNKIKVIKGQSSELSLNYDKITNELINSEKSQSIKVVTEIPDSIEAPVKKGDKIGLVKLLIDDKVYKTYDVLAKHSVNKTDFKFNLLKLLKILTTI